MKKTKPKKKLKLKKRLSKSPRRQTEEFEEKVRPSKDTEIVMKKVKSDNEGDDNDVPV